MEADCGQQCADRSFQGAYQLGMNSIIHVASHMLLPGGRFADSTAGRRKVLGQGNKLEFQSFMCLGNVYLLITGIVSLEEDGKGFICALVNLVIQEFNFHLINSK